jgi:hypothetical protein
MTCRGRASSACIAHRDQIDVDRKGGFAQQLVA